MHTGLFFIGIGVGMILSTMLVLPAELNFIKPFIWVIVIIIGVIFLIRSGR